MPAFDAASFGTANGQSFLTISHTVGSGSNRVMYVGITDDGGGSVTVTGVTWNGSSAGATELHDGIQAPAFNHLAVWRITAPASGTANVVITFSGTTNSAAGVVSMSGAHQTTPNDAIDIVGGADTSTVTNDVASESGDLVLDVVAFAPDATSGAPDTNQTEHVDVYNATGVCGILMSTKAGATSVAMGWTLNAVGSYTAAGLNINNAAAGPSSVVFPRWNSVRR